MKKIAISAGKRVFILEDPARHLYTEYELGNLPFQIQKDCTCFLFMPVQYMRIPPTVDPSTVSSPENALCVVNEKEYTSVYSTSLNYVEELKKSFKKVIPYHAVVKRNVLSETNAVVLDFIQSAGKTENEHLCLFSVSAPGEVSSKVIKVSENFQLEVERNIRAARLEKFSIFTNDSSMSQLQTLRDAGIEINEFSKEFDSYLPGFVLPRELLAETQKKKLRRTGVAIVFLVIVNLVFLFIAMTLQAKIDALVNTNRIVQSQMERLKSEISGVPAEYVLSEAQVEDFKRFLYLIEHFPEHSDVKLKEFQYSRSDKKITIIGKFSKDEISSYTSLFGAKKAETKFLQDGKVEVVFVW